MRVLVTGAGGFLGGAIARRLCVDGHEVVACVRRAHGHNLDDTGADIRVMDVRDRKSVETHMQGVTHVYHIAAAYRREHADHGEFTRVNVEGTRHLLDAAIAQNVQRFVHCSTVGVHGHITTPPANENQAYAPSDHYQRSKLEGEQLAKDYFERGLPGVIIRPTALYGPGDSRFLKLFRTIQNGTFCMIGSGETLYHMVFIDDAVEGFLRAGVREEAIGETLVVGGARYTTIRELVDTVADVLDKPHPRMRIPMWSAEVLAVACDRICRTVGVQPPLYPRRLDFFKNNRAFTSERAKLLLGYVPQVDLRDGLEQTADWYFKEGLLSGGPAVLPNAVGGTKDV